MLAWCSLQALSAAVLLPTSLGLALPAFPLHERRTALGIWAAIGAMALCAGTVFGGLLIQVSWQWAVLLSVPVVIVAMLAGSVVLPRDPVTRGGARFDSVGLVLVVGAMGLLSVGLMVAPDWPALPTLVLLGTAAGLAALFVVHALRHPEPVVPRRLFRARRFALSAAAMFCYDAGSSLTLFGIALVLEQIMHLSLLETAFAILPGAFTTSVAAPFSGWVVARLGVRRTLLAGACLLALAAWSLVASGDAPTYVWVILPGLVCWGVSDALIPPTLFGGTDAAPGDDLTLAAAVLQAARQVGAAFGVVLLAAVLGATGLSVQPGIWGIVLASAFLTAVIGAFASRPAAYLYSGPAAAQSSVSPGT
jgi:MFS family permease